MTKKSASRSENECMPSAIRLWEWARKPTTICASVSTRFTPTLTQVDALGRLGSTFRVEGSLRRGRKGRLT